MMITTPSVLASLVLAGSLVANSVAAPLFPPIANLIPVSSSPVLAPAGDGTSSAAGSRQTPKGIPSSADLMDLSQLSKLFGATNRGNGLTPPHDPSMGLSTAKGIEPGVLLGEVPLGDTIGTAMKLVPAGQTIPPVTTPASLASSTNMTCLDSSFTDVEITSLFAQGGAGTIVYLCPNAVILTTAAITFSAPGQVLTTQGDPRDDSRALVRVTGPTQSAAIFGSCNACGGIQVRNIRVDGNRPVLGYMKTGLALIEIGGPTSGQRVDYVHSFEPRGWSALHIIEGSGQKCEGATITNNDIGPSGNGPSNPLVQFRGKRQLIVPPGQWADGISLACTNSTVQGNTITDATDGAIVIFGAPGSTISDNKIVSVSRQLLGGINLVDFAPYAGDYTGTTVTNNAVTAQSDFIKIGIAVGFNVWSGGPGDPASRNFGAKIMGNALSSGGSGYFGYGIAISGMNDTTVTGNNFAGANFGSLLTPACIFNLPNPGAFYVDRSTTARLTLQSEFVDSNDLGLLICRGPGPILFGGLNL